MDPGPSIDAGVARLAADGFVAYPTETVWGLGACATSSVAIERMRAWKGRAADAPMSVLVASVEQALELGCRLEPPARRLIEAYWPGPLTLVVPCSKRFAPGVARSDGALGLRCSSHPIAHALAAAVARGGRGPLTSTSLNRSGEPPAADIEAVRALVGTEDASDPCTPHVVWVEGGDAGGGAPSSVVDCTGDRPEIIRCGAIDRAALEGTWTRSTARSGRT